MPETRGDPGQDPTVVLDTFGFRVPCRSFYVKANVTRDRRLPIVNEHVLRLVRICTSISVARLREFFGMSRSEVEMVVDDLERTGLIVPEGDDLRLSANAAAMFRSHPDGEPSLMTIEPWIELVWIDLISRAFVAMPRGRASRNLLEVLASRESLDLPEAFARTSFEENFYDYVRQVKRLRDPDRVSIHSIAEVEADQFGSVTIVGRKVLDRDAVVPRFEVEVAAASPGAAPRLTRLVQTLADVYGGLGQPRSAAATIETFERWTGQSLRRLLNAGTGQLMVDAVRREAGSGLVVWGAGYLSRNVEQVVAALRDGPAPAEHSVKWLRPGGTGWGVSNDLVEALATLRNSASGVRSTSLFMPRAIREDARRRFASLFDYGYEASTRFGASIEALVVDELVAMVLVHLPVEGHQTIPVGVIVEDRALAQRIGKTISSDQSLWVPPPYRGLRDQTTGQMPQ